eukprot:1435216-Amphidinium_carterae.1
MPYARQFHDSLLAFVPKVVRPTCSPDQFRPLSLKNCISKLVSSALSNLMAKAFPCLLHLAQYGAQKGRSIADAFYFLEKAAFSLSSSPWACLLFCDIRTAYPTLRRSWPWEVLRASGIPQELEAVFESILAPMRMWISWKRRHWG